MIKENLNFDNRPEKNFNDFLLFERQKIVALYVIQNNFKHLGYAPSQRAELIDSIHRCMIFVFNFEFANESIDQLFKKDE